MPELPEVEAARRALHDNCCSRLIVKASVADDPKVIDGVASSALQSALIGRKIVAAHRKGKNLWLQLDQRPWPSFQFGMTGAFHIKGMQVTKYKRSAVNDGEEWPSKFSKVFFELEDGLEVSFTDKRRFARVRLLDDPISSPPISELGPDALLEFPEESAFISRVTKKKCPIKALLLDQSFLAGIGNWVADEVLYQARIHPEQIAAALTEDECRALHNTIREVIKFSVEVNADSELFPVSWIFHYRWDKKPGKVDGKKIEFITVGGRTSAFVPALQRCTGPSVGKTTSTARKKSVKEEPVEAERVEIGGETFKQKAGRRRKSTKMVEQVIQDGFDKVEGHEIDKETQKKGGRKKKDPMGIAKKSEVVSMNVEESENNDDTIKKKKSKRNVKAADKKGKLKVRDVVTKKILRSPKNAEQEEGHAEPDVHVNSVASRRARQPVLMEKQAEQKQQTEQKGKAHGSVTNGQSQAKDGKPSVEVGTNIRSRRVAGKPKAMIVKKSSVLNDQKSGQLLKSSPLEETIPYENQGQKRKRGAKR